MRKRLSLMVVLSMLAVFATAATITIATAAKPGCNKCRKDGCPSGYCYVDCVGCCFNHPTLGLVCFR